MFNSEATYALAIAVVVGLAAAVVVAADRNARRHKFTRSQYFLYFMGCWLTRVLWRTRVVGNVNLPENGGAVLVANHRGPVDPAFIALACHRPAHWMVAREYFEVPVFGRWLRLLGSIPTRRSGIDTAAIKQTIRILHDGEFVGMMPEGRINQTDELLLPLRGGVALIALEAEAPIVPFFIEGSPFDAVHFYSFFFRPAKVTITVGPPIDVREYSGLNDSHEAQDALTRRIGREIAALAGVADYEPRLAGRRQSDENAIESSSSG
jgi:1-acyl-sn-glycerol-3-phosphate acyltransferase